MNDTRTLLLSRKRDLFAALRSLEQDREDGSVDDTAYRTARRRYESEAAEILEQLDILSQEQTDFVTTSRQVPLRWRSSRVAMTGAGALVVVAMTLILVAALHPGGASPAATVSPQRGAGPADSSQVRQADNAVRAHPRSVNALIRLGNAYVQIGRTREADGAYVAALRLQPLSSEATILHAMMLGSAGQYTRATRLLHGTEARDPTFAKAWLLDGLFAGHKPNGRARAIADWRRFLKLQPAGPAAAEVRGFITAAEKTGKNATAG
ncbi:MAG: tetratricopeptide repeat protein [Chloroflexota bacterium]|nr:MAG: hypothetical protein DLM70_10680 [Chloroflexota bacterium]